MGAFPATAGNSKANRVRAEQQRSETREPEEQHSWEPTGGTKTARGNREPEQGNHDGTGKNPDHGTRTKASEQPSRKNLRDESRNPRNPGTKNREPGT